MGWTALLMAERKGHRAIADMLRQGVVESSLPRLIASEPDHITSDLTSTLDPLDPNLDHDSPTH